MESIVVSKIPSFNFNGSKVEVQIDGNGKEWFNGNDVCKCLGYKNPRDAISKFTQEGDVVLRDTIDRLGRTQQSKFINESGLYDLIIDSGMKEAKAFRRWITSEVLPTIRRTGSYNPKQPIAPKPAVRYSYDSLAEKHKELCSHFRTWFSRKAKRPPTDKEVADFIIEVNMVCLGEETNTRSHLTLEGAYRIQNGCQILINQFKKGYRNTERFKSMFIEYYGSTDITKTLIPKEERLELVERLSIEG